MDLLLQAHPTHHDDSKKWWEMGGSSRGVRMWGVANKRLKMWDLFQAPVWLGLGFEDDAPA